jgi:N utilization substance protein A
VKNDFMMAINQVCHERQLPIDIVLEAVEVAFISAFKRNAAASLSITAQIDPQSGEAMIFVEKAIVEEVQDEKNEISLEDAKAINPNAQINGIVSIESTPANFGRIAAQTAKQVILQRIREAERDALYNTYAEREGEIVSGTVHKIDPHQVTLSLGKVEAFLPRNEQIPTERYSEGQRLRAYISSVIKSSRGPQIIVSRTHRNMLRRLLEVEVPEIYNGTVEIKSIAREAGHRSKVAVAALQEGVDPVGSCVGMRGTRIQSIVNELNGEKIDVVQWNPDLSFFIASSLSPAKVMNVMLYDRDGKTAVVVVPDRQLSLAIGKEGQNARLAAKLTGWRIDIKSTGEAIEETLTKIRENEAIKERVAAKPEIFNMAATIHAEKEPGDYSDAELKILSEAIETVNLAEMAIARELKAQEEAAAKAAQEAAKARDILAEAEAILGGHTPAGEAELVEDAEVEGAETAESTVIEEAEAAAMGALAASAVTEEEMAAAVEPVDGVEVVEEQAEAEPAVEEAEEIVAEVETLLAEETEEGEEISPLRVGRASSDDDWDDDDGLDELERARQKKKAREKKRRLIFDENLGEVVAERRRKQSRRGTDWLDYEEDE